MQSFFCLFKISKETQPWYKTAKLIFPSKKVYI